MGFVIGMAGHVDHGKSSVIKALTGITTARYREEIEREITIDIGFAHIDIDGIGPVSIIDVPGHEDFVHNMLAGIFGARLALLVTAANEGIMPQTIEHLDILNYCGVEKIIVVLNKIDLADKDDIDYRICEIEDFLKNTRFKDSKVVCFSAVNKTGAAGLKSAIKEEIESIRRSSPADGLFFLNSYVSDADVRHAVALYPIDRAFEKAGYGQILTGTLIEGRLAVDETYKIISCGEFKIRSIESHGIKYNEVDRGLRAAVNVTKTRDFESVVSRGCFLVSDEIACEYRCVTVKLRASNNLKHKIKSGANIKFYFYSACYSAKLRLLDTAALEAGDFCAAQIIFNVPGFALIFKPFIIRTHTDEETIGGGIITGCYEEFIKNKKVLIEKISIYNDCSINKAPAENYVIYELEKRGFIEADAACAAFMRVREKIIDAVSAFCPSDNYFLIKGRYITGDKIIANFKKKAVDKIEKYLDANKLNAGIVKSDIVKLFTAFPDAGDNAFFAYIIDSLMYDGFLKNNDGFLKNNDGFLFPITSSGKVKSNLTLEGDSEIIRRKIMNAFNAALLIPITLEGVKSTVAKNQMELFNKIVKFLENEKNIFKIFENYYISVAQLDKYIKLIKAILAAKLSFTVIDFKDKTSLSRKYAVAVLEFLDRQGITKRRDNERYLDEKFNAK